MKWPRPQYAELSDGPVTRGIVEWFGDEGLHWSCLVWDGETKFNRLLEIVKQDLREKKPEADLPVCFEIGTHRGVSSTIIAMAGFRVVTADIEEDPIREKVWAHFGVRDRISPIKVAGNTEISLISADQPYDLAYIDGDHRYKSARDNFLAFRHCGRVIFHDYDRALQAHRVCRAADEILDGSLIINEPFALWLEDPKYKSLGNSV